MLIPQELQLSQYLLIIYRVCFNSLQNYIKTEKNANEREGNVVEPLCYVWL